MVKRLERALRRTPNLGLAVDGVFGPQLEAAVKEFHQGLSITIPCPSSFVEFRGPPRRGRFCHVKSCGLVFTRPGFPALVREHYGVILSRHGAPHAAEGSHHDLDGFFPRKFILTEIGGADPLVGSDPGGDALAMSSQRRPSLARRRRPIRGHKGCRTGLGLSRRALHIVIARSAGLSECEGARMVSSQPEARLRSSVSSRSVSARGCSRDEPPLGSRSWL
jgi:hypothetical protein